MKRSPLTLTVGAVLLLVFGLLLFMFQVRQSQVAVITRFGNPDRERMAPGAYFKLPWPIERVHKLDQRVQNLESKYEETLTTDGFNLVVQVYVGWHISEPTNFFPKFASGSVGEAEKTIESLVRSVKNEVVGRHPFSHFISTDEKELQFAAIEKEMLDKVRNQVRANQYGLEVKFLGIKKLGLPESVTKTVFARMESERQVLVSDIRAKGEAKAITTRADADRASAEILSKAEGEATRIRGEGEAKAAESFAVFNQNTNLANLLFKLRTLEAMLKDKSTLILDPNTPGLDLLRNQPAPPK
ncbi:MAG: protease modulator HflC [Verrucomicrobia bacterium]|nr:protease modulator HflC [Verrucomicrobiota bacterium]